MKKQLIVSIFTALILGTGSVIAAEDYSGYSNEELFQMRGQVGMMNEEDREAYRAERKNRTQNMSQEERQTMKQNQGGNAGTQNDNGERKQLRDGSGGGKQYGRANGQGSGQGRGR